MYLKFEFKFEFNMEPQRPWTCAVWVLQVEGEGTPTANLSFACRGLSKAMENGISTMRASHAFIEVVVYIDSKRVARNGTFIRVAVDLSCRDVLTKFMSTHDPDYSPLPGDGT
jgi:hypothetical protein